MLRIITLNLNGIRSAYNKGAYAWLCKQGADFVCLQEIKAQHQDLSDEMTNPEGFHAYYHVAEKKGYSGVGLWCRQKPERVFNGLQEILPQEFSHPVARAQLAEFDAEGRYLRVDIGKLSVISVYVPSGSSSPERQSVKFRFLDCFYPHLYALAAQGRDVVVCGDFNIAHQEIDLKNWKSNQKNSGFLPEERAWFGQVLNTAAWCDTYRQIHPEATDACYTWWSNRGQAWAKNVGWRLDYQIATPAMRSHVQAAAVYKTQRFSDHAPLTVDYAYS